MRILAATGNAGKLKELAAVAAEFGIELLSPKQVELESGLSAAPDVDETGATYRENALLKAQALFEWSGLPTLGDDSGFEVRIMAGRPGVYSARYGGEEISAAERNQKLIAEIQALEAHSGRRDRYVDHVCHLCLVRPAAESVHLEFRLPGEILDQPQGANGFGYDPIVKLPELGKTMAELDFDEKVKFAVRGQAARELFRKLSR